MVVESKKVMCEWCKGSAVASAPNPNPECEVRTGSLACEGCDGTGEMELRKSANSDWASKCLTCEGKGFNDSWDYQSEKHGTVDCADCSGTGGITYPHAV